MERRFPRKRHTAGAVWRKRGARPQEATNPFLKAVKRDFLGSLLAEFGKHVMAEAAYREALALQQQLADDAPGVPQNRQLLAGTHSNLGILLANLGKRTERRRQPTDRRWRSSSN